MFVGDSETVGLTRRLTADERQPLTIALLLGILPAAAILGRLIAAAYEAPRLGRPLERTSEPPTPDAIATSHAI